MERDIFVYADLRGVPHLVGRLWTRQAKGKESASFEYDESWLAHPGKFALEPALALGPGPHHTLAGRSLFGAIGDSAPDRWGRVLIQREEQRKARAENRTPRSLSESDYLLSVGDIARQGALRFAAQEGGEFLAPQNMASIPPLIRLGELLNAAIHAATGEESERELQLLLAPGSSLGGARPKASVMDQNGWLSIAKFPQGDDTWPVTLWEAIALDLASRAGIPVPDWRIEQIEGRSVVLLRRFDREGSVRIPFLSAMSMLGAQDNEQHSYLEIIDALRQHGVRPEEDARQLWRRMVFNILISSTDDHLRNHGFLYNAGGWQLSPAYDLNPTPTDIKQRYLSLAINETDTTASLPLAFEVAPRFGLKAADAKEIAAEIAHATSGWRDRAASFGLTAKEITRMESAFEHDDLRLALNK